MNVKPLRWFNIGIRFGFASGQPRNQAGAEMKSEPVIVLELDEDGNPVIPSGGVPKIIQKYYRPSWYDENERGVWSLPLDIKFSFLLFDNKGRVTTEIYLAAENLATLFYKPKGGSSLNEYTGKYDTTSSASGSMFDLPIPMVSFGFKWRY
jgi:hypothetical protein